MRENLSCCQIFHVKISSLFLSPVEKASSISSNVKKEYENVKKAAACTLDPTSRAAELSLKFLSDAIDIHAVLPEMDFSPSSRLLTKANVSRKTLCVCKPTAKKNLQSQNGADVRVVHG